MISIIQTNVGGLPLTGNILSGDFGPVEDVIQSLQQDLSGLSSGAILKDQVLFDLSGDVVVRGSYV